MVRSLKVVLVIDSLEPGGTERSLAEMVPRLAALGVDPTVVTLRSRERGYEEDLRLSGCDVRVLRAARRTGRVRELRRVLRALDPDIVHTHLFEADVTGRLAAVRTRAAVLTSLVNTSYDPVRRHDPAIRSHRLGAARMVDGWTARHLTDHFHAVSNSVKESAVRHLGLRPERITVVERGRDPERLGRPGPERRRRARAALGVDLSTRLVVNIGRQEFQKGQRYLLEAFEALARSRADVMLMVAGRAGAAAADLEERRRRSVFGDRMHFLGARDDVPELLAAADVFVSSSLYEGLPGVVLEAFALGVPVVATDIGPHRDVAVDGKSALLVPPEAPMPLRAAMERVLEDPALATELGARGRQAFERRFTLDASVEKMVALYERVARSA